MAMAGAIGATPQLVSAQVARPQISVQRDNDVARSVLVDAGELKLRHQLMPDAFVLTLLTGADRLTIAGAQDGPLVVEHGSVQMKVTMRSALPEQLSRLRRTLESSSALVAFDRLMASPWAKEQMPAATIGPVHALLETLRGRSAGVAAVAAMGSPRATSTVAIRLARETQTPSECWNIYSRDVLLFTYDYQTCVKSADDTWNPLHVAGCAYEYNAKAIFAAYWYASCNGV
ncbi:MAG TPA: hypothetical protein VNJ02_12520 [Vicinamibacterales bacterium]|nr:hypothetical protein [Vicinamibacterales bacterium]